ncbi:hypothetical protein LO762_09230 [Actinocorallia sp. API 0066]|nr:hypothetical protein [Actinocorallia sp. API 0066]MCD0449370.1 hypothetical protein [Actinocorallia sp. API 0066]
MAEGSAMRALDGPVMRARAAVEGLRRALAGSGWKYGASRPGTRSPRSP